ncbi:MAG: YihY/virulence factor BrkB family protein [Cytophagales bacterium]|nr:YihY/virulence factor BrkB family protein [Cytophagales bacterium]MDW8384412.1 YihY/virulence factor BrkB family protein [Flammeovirgaceae bacterium]
MTKYFRTSNKNFLYKVSQFLERDLWHVQIDKISKEKAILIRILRTIVLASRGFKETQCVLRASALTLFSLLSIVPILALGFGIAKGFGLEKNLRIALRSKFVGQEELFNKLMQFSMASLKNTRGDIIAGVGLIVLIFIVMRMLHNVEGTFNAIWKVTKPRSLARKLTDYLAIMMITPIMIIFSSSITVYIHTGLKNITNKTENFLSFLDPILLFTYDLLPLLLIWLLISINYIIIPNTNVNFKSAFLAGFLTAIAYHITQWAYIKFQVGVATYNAIYGSFAALPLFIIWLQISWIIILFGAEIAFAHQNSYKYEFEKESLQLSIYSRKKLALLIMHHIIKNFQEGKPAMNLTELSKKVEIPQRFVELTLEDLEGAGIIIPTYLKEKESPVFLPTKDTRLLTDEHILERVEQKGINVFELLNIPVR